VVQLPACSLSDSGHSTVETGKAMKLAGRRISTNILLRSICPATSATASVPNPYLSGGRPALSEKTVPSSLYAGFGSPVVPYRMPLDA